MKNQSLIPLKGRGLVCFTLRSYSCHTGDLLKSQFTFLDKAKESVPGLERRELIFRIRLILGQIT